MLQYVSMHANGRRCHTVDWIVVVCHLCGVRVSCVVEPVRLSCCSGAWGKNRSFHVSRLCLIHDWCVERARLLLYCTAQVVLVISTRCTLPNGDSTRALFIGDQSVGAMVPLAHWTHHPELVHGVELLDATHAHKVRTW